MTEEVIDFVTLNECSDYEILNKYPFTIRRKDNHYVVKESLVNGYPRISLHSKSYKKHILIAKQFLYNDDPEHKIFIDHKNRLRSDYHLSNLRWVTASENSKNKVGAKNGIIYEYVDNISDDAIKVTDYGEHELEDYFYYDNIFYFYNGLQYRKLHINENKDGYKFVEMKDINNKRVCVCYLQFKKLYDLD